MGAFVEHFSIRIGCFFIQHTRCHHFLYINKIRWEMVFGFPLARFHQKYISIDTIAAFSLSHSAQHVIYMVYLYNIYHAAWPPFAQIDYPDTRKTCLVCLQEDEFVYRLSNSLQKFICIGLTISVYTILQIVEALHNVYPCHVFVDIAARQPEELYKLAISLSHEDEEPETFLFFSSLHIGRVFAFRQEDTLMKCGRLLETCA